MRATFHLLLCASAVAGLSALGACTQDGFSSNSERDTHMGAAGHEADAAPPLPAAANPPPSAAAPVPAAPAPVASAAPADAGVDAALAKAGDAGAAAAAPAAKPKHK